MSIYLNSVNKLTLGFFMILMNYPLLAQETKFRMTTIGQNNFLETPWDLHYGFDDYLWVTERERGVVVRVDPDTGERDELLQLTDVFFTSRQDGLLGMALHEEIEQDSSYVYLSYTYFEQKQYQKIVRYTYQINENNGALTSPITLIDKLPSSNDHNSGRLIFGPDGKLYYTIGDQGSNHLDNYCKSNLAQELPTLEEVAQQNWIKYAGKILRLNTDGTIPADNPELENVRSHIYSYGHRNPQGIVFGNNGLLYSDEHGPVTDDEVNIIYAGKNYGWPFVAGFMDNQVYSYCNWSSAENCSSLNFQVDNCPSNAELFQETDLSVPNYQEPLASMFAVTEDFDFNNPLCETAFICRPNIAPSSIAIYESDAISAWESSLLITSLKRGQVYRYQLDKSGTRIIGDTTRHFYTPNRYRDIAIHPDGKTIYLLTDNVGQTSGPEGFTRILNLQNPGNILKFTLGESVSTQNEDQTIILKVYPNPTNDFLFLEFLNPNADRYQIELYSAEGQKMLQHNNVLVSRSKIFVKNLPSGLYIIKVYSSNGTWQKQLIIL